MGRPRTSTRKPPRKNKFEVGPKQAGYDWRNYPKKYWPYTGLDDPRYINDKNALFHQHGNGWFWFAGTAEMQVFKKNREKTLNEDQTHN